MIKSVLSCYTFISGAHQTQALDNQSLTDGLLWHSTAVAQHCCASAANTLSLSAMTVLLSGNYKEKYMTVEYSTV